MVALDGNFVAAARDGGGVLFKERFNGLARGDAVFDDFARLQGSVETALLHPIDARYGLGGEGVGFCAVDFFKGNGALLGVG